MGDARIEAETRQSAVAVKVEVNDSPAQDLVIAEMRARKESLKAHMDTMKRRKENGECSYHFRERILDFALHQNRSVSRRNRLRTRLFTKYLHAALVD